MTNESFNVNDELASAAGVSVGTIHNYKDIMANGGPELIEQVRRGEVSIGAAHRGLEKELLKQLTQAGKTFDFIAKYIPFDDSPDLNRELRNLFGSIAGHIASMAQRLTIKEAS